MGEGTQSLHGLQGAGCQGTDLEQVSDVRDDPGLAGFDKPVLPELGDVAIEDVRLPGQHVDQPAQGQAQVGVPQPVHGWQEPVEVVRRVRHGRLPMVRPAASGLTVMSWAAFGP